MSSEIKVPPSKPRMKVLSVGLPRTGSASIAQALTILGYENVYHTLYHIEDQAAWQTLNNACDATFPNLPSYRGHSFTQAEWEELFYSCEAATDVVGCFGPQVAKAYPDAKVILVEREFEKWFKSLDEGLLKSLWTGMIGFGIDHVEPFLGMDGGTAVRKLFLGLFRARNYEECKSHAREAHERYHEEVRAACSDRPERLLHYKLGSGWEPLCEFLGRPVPDKPFPWTNEMKMLREVALGISQKRLRMAIVKGLPYVAGASALAFSAYFLLR